MNVDRALANLHMGKYQLLPTVHREEQTMPSLVFLNKIIDPIRKYSREYWCSSPA
jgi:hypothetical protein